MTTDPSGSTEDERDAEAAEDQRLYLRESDPEFAEMCAAEEAPDA